MTSSADQPESSIHDDGNEQHAVVESRGLTRTTFRDRRRQNLLAIAFTVTIASVGILWWQGFFEVMRASSAHTIPAGVLWQDLCDEAKKERSEKLQASFEVNDPLIRSTLAEMDWLETLILDQGVVTDESMKAIAALPNLGHLRLRLSPISDAGLKRLTGCENLWLLNLPHANCTAEGVASLASLPRLRQLRLGCPNLGNDVTRAIASITTLRSVHLIGVPVTDEGLRTLATMPHLESLYLDDSAVTAAGWEWLFREQPHLHVHVNQRHLDRDPKAHTHH